jgi:hypothetical protein
VDSWTSIANGVEVYVRGGDAFQTLELPDLPEANIPDKLKHGRKFPHVANPKLAGSGSLIEGWLARREHCHRDRW